MQPCRSAKRQQGETSRINASAYSGKPDTFCHLRVNHTVNPLRCRHTADAKFSA